MKWMSETNFAEAFQGKESQFYITNSNQPLPTVIDTKYLEKPPHPFGLYSVTRVNPLFIEEVHGKGDTVDYQDKENFSCDLNCDKTPYLHALPLREDALTVLKQNTDFIRSILVSVRLGRCQKRNPPNGLTPIPEGKIDCCVPPPIWPRDERNRCSPDNDIRRTYRGSRKRDKRQRWKYDPKPINVCKDVIENCHQSQFIENKMVYEKQKSLPEILRELSVSINTAMENVTNGTDLPAEAVLHSLRDKINKCLSVSITPDEANIKDCTVATLSKAFSFVNSPDGSQDDLENGRLLLLKRLGKFPPADYERVQRSGSSSSSAASTSGFSDLTHTPASSNSSASESPTASRTIVENSEARVGNGDGVKNGNASANGNVNGSGNGVFTFRDNALVCKSVYETASCNVKNTLSFSAFQYRVVQNNQNIFPTNAIVNGSAMFDGLVKLNDCKLGVPNVHLYSKSDTLLSSYPGHRCPDFTLDVQQSEKVMKKIKHRKKERCWCRVVTSCVGFAFLLFSVMFFSMMLTRGEKLFGSL